MSTLLQQRPTVERSTPWDEDLIEFLQCRLLLPAIGAAFARRSLALDCLSVSYVVNAQDFFKACNHDWIWHSLETLALTSELLRPAEDPLRIIGLLCSAGRTALQMPKLRTIVLWNGSKGNASAFSYQAGPDRTCITWRGTWDHDFSPGVVATWQRVASKLYPWPRELETRTQKIDSEILSHGDAIQFLDLPCRVVEPASSWQIRSEGRLLAGPRPQT